MKQIIKTYKRIVEIEERINENYEDMTRKQQTSIKERENKACLKLAKEIKESDKETILAFETYAGVDASEWLEMWG